MNGDADLGGMQGFGPVVEEANDAAQGVERNFAQRRCFKTVLGVPLEQEGVGKLMNVGNVHVECCRRGRGRT